MLGLRFFASSLRSQSGFFSKNTWYSSLVKRTPYISPAGSSTKSFLQSTFFPTRQRFATHRDINFKQSGRSNGGHNRGSSSNNFGGSNFMGKLRYNWYIYKGPLLFSLGFVMINSVIWPYVFKLPGFSELKKKPENVIYAIMGINAAVFVGWRIGRGRILKYLTRFGILHKDSNYNNWQLLGSAFSHMEFLHFGMNMFVLYQFGVPVARSIGAERTLEIYLDGCVLGNLASILTPLVIGRKIVNGSLGASGAVFTMFGLMTYLNPAMNVSIMFIPFPMNGWNVFMGSLGVNAAGIVFKWGGIDWAAHIGGSLVAIMWGQWYQYKRRKILEQRRRGFW